MLNALTWVAGVEVPPEGVPSRTPTFEELAAGQDEPTPGKDKLDAIRADLKRWHPATGAAK
jgi:hypothetical protein